MALALMARRPATPLIREVIRRRRNEVDEERKGTAREEVRGKKRKRNQEEGKEAVLTKTLPFFGDDRLKGIRIDTTTARG